MSSKQPKKITFWITMILILIIAYVSIFGLSIGKFKVPSAKDMRFGIDIRGGVEATYFPKDYDGKPTTEELEAVKAVIEKRCDSQNISDRDIYITEANGSVTVRFPWKSDEKEFDAEKAISELGATAKLTFRDSQGNVLVEGKNVEKATPSVDEKGNPIVDLKFNSEGAKQFEQATASNVGMPLYIYMDENIISAPTVQSTISGGKAMITGDFTSAEVKTLSSQINSGALPFDLESKNYSGISPMMGEGALNIMVWAALAAFILICLFMIIVYRLPGFVAVFALTLQVAGQLLAVSVPQYTLTLQGIAAIILSIGMGVDANIITAERIKEEIADGKTVGAAIDAGFHKAFSSVFDGNITVIIVAAILMYFGSGSMLSFGYSLLTGVILNFVCGVVASKLMMKSLGRYKCLKKTKLYGSGKKQTRVFGFFKNRKKFYALSAIIFIVGIAGMFINGVNLDIQFKGGAIVDYTYTGDIDSTKAEQIAEKAIKRECTVQEKTAVVGNTTMLSVNIAGDEGLSSGEQEQLTTALETSFPKNEIKQYNVQTVEPFIGKDYARRSLVAVAIAAVLIILYVWFSFRKVSGLSAGVTGLIALLHDVIVVFFAFIVFNIPINESFIAAALTILGFSINDTIVIFDRIRENKIAYGTKLSTAELVDKSISQSFTRSLNTSLCTLFSIALVFAFAVARGVDSITSFALPMIFGIVSGCYSSVCIAGPLWTTWQNYKQKKRRQQR